MSSLDKYDIAQLEEELKARISGIATRGKRYSESDIIEALRKKQTSIYGVDNRQDVIEITDKLIQEDVDSVVGLFHKNRVVDQGNGKIKIKTSIYKEVFVENLKEWVSLCEDEKFYKQPFAPLSTGFLVGPDLIATAGHCVIPEANGGIELKDIRFIFGFKMKNASDVTDLFDNSEIYTSQKIVGYQLSRSGSDWAIVKLDRVVANHKVAKINRDRISENQQLHVIGHPQGLPLKYAGDAYVRDNTPKPFFISNTDTLGGSSGSPVFNSKTHLVEGILVRGSPDFRKTENTCAKSLVCPMVKNVSNCTGEDCTRCSEFKSHIPKVP